MTLPSATPDCLVSVTQAGPGGREAGVREGRTLGSPIRLRTLRATTGRQVQARGTRSSFRSFRWVPAWGLGSRASRTWGGGGRRCPTHGGAEAPPQPVVSASRSLGSPPPPPRAVPTRHARWHHRPDQGPSALDFGSRAEVAARVPRRTRGEEEERGGGLPSPSGIPGSRFPAPVSSRPLSHPVTHRVSLPSVRGRARAAVRMQRIAL